MAEFDCKKCLHEKVCALWAEYECQDASCFCQDGCDYFTPTLTPPNEWVSVEERLPEPGERVLAAKGTFAGEAYLASNGAWMRHDGFPWEVDAWMPLPAPPDRRPPEGEEDT